MKPYLESARFSLPAGRIFEAIVTTVVAPIGKFLFWSLAFGLAYTQSPLYTSNQNTKFFHGLANGGLGFLKEDWLATTIDPLPVFSFLVYVTYRYFHEGMFYFYNILIFGAYLYGMSGIASRIYKIDSSRPQYLTFLVIIIALHSYAFDSLSLRVFGVELGQLLQYGVAEQHLVGRIFQPSVFGVLIVLSIYAFLCEQPFLAAFLLGLSAIIHPTYLLSAAILTLSYMVVLFAEEKSVKKPLAVGLFNFVLLLPVLGYFYIHFRPTSPEIWSQSHAILANFRSPQHMNPQVWLGGAAYAKAAVTVLAVYLVRQTRLFPIMLFPLLTAIALTIVQILWGDNSLAASTPWRVSIFLVPLSVCIIVAYLVSRLFKRFREQTDKHRRVITVLNLAAALLLVLYGVIAQVKRHVTYYRDDSIAMMNFVRETKSPGEIYLIPVELEDFRLYTGAPTFVTFKSGPFKDSEYLEWYKRLVRANDFYIAHNGVACEMLRGLEVDYQLTHVVVKGPRPDVRCGNLYELYRDDQYRVYKIEKQRSPHEIADGSRDQF